MKTENERSIEGTGMSQADWRELIKLIFMVMYDRGVTQLVPQTTAKSENLQQPLSLWELLRR